MTRPYVPGVTAVRVLRRAMSSPLLRVVAANGHEHRALMRLQAQGIVRRHGTLNLWEVIR